MKELNEKLIISIAVGSISHRIRLLFSFFHLKKSVEAKAPSSIKAVYAD